MYGEMIQTISYYIKYTVYLPGRCYRNCVLFSQSQHFLGLRRWQILRRGRFQTEFIRVQPLAHPIDVDTLTTSGQTTILG